MDCKNNWRYSLAAFASVPLCPIPFAADVARFAIERLKIRLSEFSWRIYCFKFPFRSAYRIVFRFRCLAAFVHQRKIIETNANNSDSFCGLVKTCLRLWLTFLVSYKAYVFLPFPVSRFAFWSMSMSFCGEWSVVLVLREQ